MSYRKKNILGAAALAIVAVVFMLVYISKAHSGGTPKPTVSGSVSVLVATRDISAGTPGTSLQRGALAVRKVPASAVVPGAIASATVLSREVATQDIMAGQQVTQREFGPRADSGVRIELRGRERAVQLEGDASQVLDGTLRPGDHVDVLGTWNVPENCSTCHFSRTIVGNALVLATSAELGKPTLANTQSIPVQLRLTDAQAQRVFWMVKNGQWWLELRPVVGVRSSGGTAETARSILGGSK